MKTKKDIEIKPFADLEGAYLIGANLEGADLRGANLRGADLEGADLRNDNLQNANLYGAYLIGANLRDANLRDADLYGADLIGANLRHANLEGANLEGANLSHTKGIISFTLGKDFGFSFKYEGATYVKIGCECHAIEHWLTEGESIGKKNNYSPEEIKIHLKMLELIKEIEEMK